MKKYYAIICSKFNPNKNENFEDYILRWHSLFKELKNAEEHIRSCQNFWKHKCNAEIIEIIPNGKPWIEGE